MANRLRMAKVHSIQTLHAQGWSQRRIARALGVDRETVARYVHAAAAEFQNQPNPPAGSDGHPFIGLHGHADALGHDPPAAGQNQPNPPAGSSGPPSRCEPMREAIVAALQRGLSSQRIWQDLRSEHGFAGSYDSVKRFCRRLKHASPLPFRRMECEPGDEAQVDFGTAAPVIVSAGRPAPLLSPGGQPASPAVKRKRRRTHLFRIVLSHSRKAYSEAVFRQSTDDFIRCLENM